jgi:hypothetical protein
MHHHPGWLLLDVDGPLNPYAAKPFRRPPGYRTLRRTARGGWLAEPESRRTKGIRVWFRSSDRNETEGGLDEVRTLVPTWCRWCAGCIAARRPLSSQDGLVCSCVGVCDRASTTRTRPHWAVRRRPEVRMLGRVG